MPLTIADGRGDEQESTPHHGGDVGFTRVVVYSLVAIPVLVMTSGLSSSDCSWQEAIAQVLEADMAILPRVVTQEY